MNDTERRVRVQCRDRRPPVHWAPYAEQQRTWRTVLAPLVGQAPCRAPRTHAPHDVAAIRTRARAGAERAARMLCQRLRWNFCIDRHL